MKLKTELKKVIEKNEEAVAELIDEIFKAQRSPTNDNHIIRLAEDMKELGLIEEIDDDIDKTWRDMITVANLIKHYNLI